MSRIYDALRRAAEKSRRGSMPTPAAPAKPEPTVEAGEEIAALLERAEEADGASATGLGRDFDEEQRVTGDQAGSGVSDVPSVDPPEGLPRSVWEALRVRLAAEARAMRAEGRYPFEGRWLTNDQIHALRLRMRLKDLGVLCQVLLLFGGLLGLALLFFWALTDGLLPR